MESQKLQAMRHTSAHVLAAAVERLYPGAKFGVGPVVENGFYYDMLLPAPLREEDLGRIEETMQAIVKEDLEMIREEMPIDEAITFFRDRGQDFKVELLRDLKEKGTTMVGEEAVDLSLEKPYVATIYRTGDFVDLCRGPHLARTSEIGAFKVEKLAGAYWRGDENNPMLTRVYGLCFATQKELDAHLTMLEEARRRDHRKLGKQLDLFTFSEYVGSGLPLYTPRGTLVRRLLNEFVEALQSKEGYTQVWTPQMAKAELFKMSGHYDKYKDSMFRVVSNYSKEEFFLKPMNCPQHTQIYACQPRSYRDLPIRLTDFAMLYRDEKPGELSGLTRVRSFSQDDGHIFCREDQVDEEVDRALNMTKKIMAAFGFKYRYRLSTRDKQHPEKYIGDPAVWDKLEAWAERIMKRNKIDYFDGPGEAAFYAPKMDLMATDALGREWQLSTVQIDFFLPERFNLEYVDAAGKKQRPVMLHRAILGSAERFMGVLIEHLEGAFPLWLAPEQIRLATVSEGFLPFAEELKAKLEAAGLRIGLDSSGEKVGKKVRDAAMMKVPWTVVIGEKEASGGDFKVNVFGSEEDLVIPQDAFVERATESARPPAG